MSGNSVCDPFGVGENSNSSPRTSATSVMPASSAVRIASAVGAETAMMKAAPIAAVFCTISTETRLVTTTAPLDSVDAGLRQRAGELVERVMTADIFARRDDAFAGNVEARGVHRARLGMQWLHLRQQPYRTNDVVGRERQIRSPDLRDRAHRLVDQFDAAQPAADRPGQPSPPRLKSRVRAILEPDLDVDAGAEILDLDRLDLPGGSR